MDTKQRTQTGMLAVGITVALAASVSVGAQDKGDASAMSKGQGSTVMMSATDKKFVKEAAQGGIAEVKLGTLAAKQGANSNVKAFGQHMVDDHSKGNAELKQTAQGKGVTLPTDMNAEMKSEYASLSKLHGAAFDAKYVKLMRADHKEDIDEFQKEASGGKDADIKGFASKSLPMLKEHYQRIMSIGSKSSGASMSHKM